MTIKEGTVIEVAGKRIPLPEGQVLIDGEWMKASSGKSFPAINPANKEKIVDVAAGNADDIKMAVESSRRAFEQKWTTMNPPERARIIYRIAELMYERREELATIESLDNGKPLREALGDVDAAAHCFEYYAGVADKLFGQTIPYHNRYLVYTLREPIGVCANITPWNYPLFLGCRGLAPAIAAGNAAVLKPASEAPLSSLMLGQLALDAGLPPGVLNVVPGAGREAGAALATHPDIDHIAFTGSVETGMLIAKMAAEGLKPCTLELGGKSPHIVFGDADIARTVRGIIASITRNAGQTCSAGSRMLVHESVRDQFINGIKEAMEKMRLGPGLENPDMGPLVSKNQYDIVLRYMEIGKQEGATAITGGGIPSEERLSHGYFVQPTLFEAPSSSLRIAQEEIFGPVLTALTFKDIDEAIAIANGTEFGLVASIWTSDIQRATKLAAQVKAGQVYINNWGAGGAESPFGGYKKSGYGRENGMDALNVYTQTKSVISFLG